MTVSSSDELSALVGQVGGYAPLDSGLFVPSQYFPKGTSFPGSPVDGQLVYRTDLDEMFRYTTTGTKWLCTTKHYMVWSDRTTAGSAGYSATTTVSSSATLGSLGDMWIEDLFGMCYVSTTSSGSQYWTITFDKLTTANAATTIGSISTISNTANNWVEEKADIDQIVDGATYKAFLVTATKTSTPGNLFPSLDVTWRHCYDV